MPKNPRIAAKNIALHAAPAALHECADLCINSFRVIALPPPAALHARAGLCARRLGLALVASGFSGVAAVDGKCDAAIHAYGGADGLVALPADRTGQSAVADFKAVQAVLAQSGNNWTQGGQAAPFFRVSSAYQYFPIPDAEKAVNKLITGNNPGW